jgi:hypothetical protein
MAVFYRSSGVGVIFTLFKQAQGTQPNTKPVLYGSGMAAEFPVTSQLSVAIVQDLEIGSSF